MKILLELPMNCEMGRSRIHHAIYVNCWVRLDKYLKIWLGQGSPPPLDESLLEYPIKDNTPAYYTWPIMANRKDENTRNK